MNRLDARTFREVALCAALLGCSIAPETARATVLTNPGPEPTTDNGQVTNNTLTVVLPTLKGSDSGDVTIGGGWDVTNISNGLASITTQYSPFLVQAPFFLHAGWYQTTDLLDMIISIAPSPSSQRFGGACEADTWLYSAPGAGELGFPVVPGSKASVAVNPLMFTVEELTGVEPTGTASSPAFYVRSDGDYYLGQSVEVGLGPLNTNDTVYIDLPNESQVNPVAPVPEPSTFVLLSGLLGIGPALAWRRRKRKA